LKLTLALFLGTGWTAMFAPFASADILDPQFFYNGTGCPNSWCESVNLNATDTATSTTYSNVVEYVFKTAAQGSTDPTFVLGDVDLNLTTINGPTVNVLRFEKTGSTFEVFVLPGSAASNPYEPGGVLPLAEIVGSTCCSISAIANDTLFEPTAGQPGFDAGATQIYGLVATPEPMSLVLFATLIAILGIVWRPSRKQRVA
jgi:hypothetical protein